MLKNADYIWNNIIIADEKNTTKQYCKKAQVGVDLSLRKICKLNTPGYVLKSKTIASEQEELPKILFQLPESQESVTGWHIPKGTYIIHLNEGCNFGPNDTGYIILRSSLNRSGATIVSAVWDPGYCSQDGDVINTMSIRINVDTDLGIYIEENARVAQLLVFESEDTEQYNGQWQGGQIVSKLK